LSMAIRVSFVTAVLVCAGWTSAAGSDPREQKVVEYVPGVRIDWSGRRVEIDGMVVLREGMLELFACSAETREHESIVAVRARPKHIYEAIGLIGILPGRPVHYDEKAQAWKSASGERVRISVRWDRDGRKKTTHIGAWMRDVATGKPVSEMSWLFAGSVRTEDGVFLADVDGTVICVVDFPSAIIALPELKTADNEALWVTAYTDAIPPLGTRVTLVVEPADRRAALEIRVAKSGDVSCDGRVITVEKLSDRIKALKQGGSKSGATILVRVEAQSPADLAQRVEKTVRESARSGMTVRMIRESAKPKVDASPHRSDSGHP
jgi:hypothetical protein